MFSFLPQFYAPFFWPLFLLLIPLIIVYFLKLRRTRVTIPSLALWQQVVNDQRVNAPFQRFKRNLLLLLQILLLLLLVLSAMQPYFAGNETKAKKLPILVDCSASMGAVDAQGRTRLDLVKQEVLAIIDGLQTGHELTLIELGATPRRLTEFTDNKVILRKALDGMQVSDIPSKLDDGLRLAQALTRSTDQIEAVRLYSDGNLPMKNNPATGMPMAAVDFDLSFPVEFFQMPAAGTNLGITALNARRSATDHWDVFVRVEASSGTTGMDGELVLLSNGQEVGTEEVILNPGESQRLVFSVDTQQAQTLQAQLKPKGRDSLASDNTAWLSLPEGRNLKIYCPSTMVTFRHALAGMTGIALEPNEEGKSDSAEFDLVISDSLDDAARPSTAYFFVGVIPGDLSELVDVQMGEATVVDWQRDANLLQHVQLKEVLISDLPVKKEGVEDTEIERQGYEILAYGNQGPLLLRKSEGVKLTYHVLFQVDASTLPYRVGFPIMLTNLVNEAMQQASLAELQAPATGVLPPIQMAQQAELDCRITNPRGEHEERKTDPSGVLVGVAAPVIGEYEVREGSNLVAQMGVALLNSSETSLTTVDKIHFNELAVEAAAERRTTDQLWWRQLAMAALCVLLIEWWYFQKRPAGVPD